MAEKQMKTLNGYEVVDAKARQQIEELKNNGTGGGNVDLTDYATKEYVDDAVQGVIAGDIDLSNYYTKAEVDIKLDGINQTSDNRYSVLTTSIETINNAGYQTEAQVNALITTALAGIATAEGGSY